MAITKTKVNAPEGYHFMIRLNGSFYLMKGAYTAHTLNNGDKSSPYVMMQYQTTHPTGMVSTTRTSSTAAIGRTVTRSTRSTRTTAPVRSTVSRTSTSSGSSSSGSSGGGY